MPKSNGRPLSVVRLEVEQFKGIVNLVEVTPAGDVIQITGGNGAGKSSLIDGVEWILTGKILGKKPGRPPVHRGKEFARGLIDLGNSTVERKITAEGREQVIVKTADGATYNNPQTRLNKLFDALAFDPLAYSRMKPAEQREALLRLAGVDLSGFIARRAGLYQSRHDVNVEHKLAKARIGDPIKGAPKEPVNTDALEARLKEAREQIGRNAQRRHVLELQAADAQRDRAAADECAERIQQIEANLELERRRLRGLADTAAESEAKAKLQQEGVASLVDPDLDKLDAEVLAARDLNSLHLAAALRAGREKEAEKLAKKSAKLTSQIEAVDAEKVAALAAAEMPVEGLGVSDDGVTLNGLPFEEEPTSKTIEVCTAIGAGLNSQLNIALIRDGDKLDDKTFGAFVAYCEKAGLQAWVERILPSPLDNDNAIVIEAGAVKS